MNENTEVKKEDKEKLRIIHETENEVEVEFELNGRIEKTTIGKLSFGERKELLKKTLKISYEGNTPNMDMDIAEYYELLLFYSIKKSTFTKTIDFIRNLPEDIAFELVAIAEKLNPFRLPQ